MTIATGQQALASDVNTAINGRCSSGNYAGADSVNRAIPHGLVVVPKMVFIIDTAGTTLWFRISDQGALVFYGAGSIAVTAIDATNFYIGNAADYALSANKAGRTYYWMAIG